MLAQALFPHYNSNGIFAAIPVAPDLGVILADSTHREMSQRRLLQIMATGFGLMIMLLVTAAWVGYQGSQSITENAQTMVRDHLINSDRGAEVEAVIERQSKDLLDRLELVLGVCLLLAIGSAALTIWSTKQAFQNLRWHTEEISRLSMQMLEDQELVARRFSHEMHDELGQQLTGLKGILKRSTAAELDQRRQECLELLDESIASVRELSQLLRPVILDDFGLDAGLRWLADRFRERTRIDVEYKSNISGRLSDDLETHLFRIAQECLTNVARHSGATEAWVRLDVADKRVRMVVEDNGCGIPENDAKVRSSIGMVGMRARARYVDGELILSNRDEKGLRVEVLAPAFWKRDDE